MFLNQSCRGFLISRQCFFKNPVPILKRLTFFSILRPKPSLLKKTEYKLLYNFPYVKFFGGLVRSGRSCVLLSIPANIFVYYYYESMGYCLFLFGSVCIHFMMVQGFSSFFRNMVGKIYINKEGEIQDVMISSVNKFGRRIDRIHNADELINCEYPTSFAGRLGFIQISVENCDICYLVNVRTCKIHDPLVWDSLFGKMSYPEFINKSRKAKAVMKKTV